MPSIQRVIDSHNELAGLTTGDGHTQYVLLAGRAAGQTVYGGNAANDDLTLQGTSHATKTTSYVLLQPTGGSVGIGTPTPTSLLHVTLADAETATAPTVVTFGHNTSGVPVSGFGSRVSLLLHSSTTPDQPAAALDVAWRIATHATRTTFFNLQLTASGTMTRWLHNYADSTADGFNIFWGLGAGNTTMSPSGGGSYLASYNMGMGVNACAGITTGYYNVGMGLGACQRITSGVANLGFGLFAVNVATTANNIMGLGNYAAAYETVSGKIFIDMLNRTNEAGGRAGAPIYIILNATASSQEITFNVGKMGFFTNAAVAKPTAVAVTAEAIHAALVTLNLIAA